MPLKSALVLALCLSAALVLSGCQSSEERAEGYYKSGMDLLTAGDEDRALVEFRNVFKYNAFHKEARKVYADTIFKRGETREAYSQYLRLVEQYPDMVEVRQVLAEIAMSQGQWDEVERHGGAALTLAPDQPSIKALGLALDYHKAVVAREETRRDEIAATATQMLETLPENLVLRRIVIDHLLSGPNPQAAQPQVDAALELDPNAYEFHAIKMRLLSLDENIDGMGEQLKTMVRLFPENEEVKTTLTRWFLARKDIDGAEAFLRAEAGADTDDSKGHLAVVQLLNTIRGRDAGKAELARLVTANAGTPLADLYSAQLAAMAFEDGDRSGAVKALEAVLADAEASDQTRNITAMLAQMLDAAGARDRAKTLVEEVLAADSTNVDALKLRASWAIAEDRPGDAIIDLRGALSQAPRDAKAMTLMAAAHERDGNTDLMGEQLAKAFEASGAAPDEALRYAGFLRQQGRDQAAQTVLRDARRVSPVNPQVLIQLAEVLLQSSEWVQVQEIADTLRQIGNPESVQMAQRLQAVILMGQNRVEEGMSLLESEAAKSADDIRPTIVVVLTLFRAGKTTEARTFLDDALTRFPKDPSLRLLSANIDALQGNAAAAEEGYRALIAEDPTSPMPVQLLYGLLNGAGRDEDAVAVLDAGLAGMPDNATLLWVKAGRLERAGDIDGAIGIYERLYAQDTANIIVANNLASMITTYRDDQASLDRAQTIARRLRNTTEPAFQDTYGWIEYRRGNLDEALKYLEPAAKGLPKDALAQYHLGMLYADLGRKDEAIAQLEQMITLAGDSPLPQLEAAKSRLDALKKVP